MQIQESGAGYKTRSSVRTMVRFVNNKGAVYGVNCFWVTQR